MFTYFDCTQQDFSFGKTFENFIKFKVSLYYIGEVIIQQYFQIHIIYIYSD